MQLDINLLIIELYYDMLMLSKGRQRKQTTVSETLRHGRNKGTKKIMKQYERDLPLSKNFESIDYIKGNIIVHWDPKLVSHTSLNNPSCPTINKQAYFLFSF